MSSTVIQWAMAGALAGWLCAEWQRRRCRSLAIGWPTVVVTDRTCGVRAALAVAMLTTVAVTAHDTVDPSSGGSSATAFVVDVSRSMTAADVAPTRGGLAADVLRGVVQHLPGSSGLVVFAQEAVTVAPLTHDVAAVGAALREVDATHFRPGAGSEPAPALSMALDMLSRASAPRSIVLVSDGEWTESAGVDEVLSKAASLGVRIITLGVGTDAGASVGDTRPSEARHVSRLDRAALETIAGRTGRSFVMATADAAKADAGAIADAIAGALQSPPAARPRSPVEWVRMGLLTGAFVLVLVHAPLPLWSGPATRRVAVAAALSITALASACAGPRGPREPLFEGNRQFDQGDYRAAVPLFERAMEEDETIAAVARFNLGVALSRLGGEEPARQLFETAGRQLADSRQRALAAFNRGVILASTERLPDAAYAFVESLTLDPSLEDARINLAIVRERMKAELPPDEALPPPPPARFIMPSPSAAPSISPHDW